VQVGDDHAFGHAVQDRFEDPALVVQLDRRFMERKGGTNGLPLQLRARF
jgi:hypothetical protein